MQQYLLKQYLYFTQWHYQSESESKTTQTAQPYKTWNRRDHAHSGKKTNVNYGQLPHYGGLQF
jgi:hypothetical protein